MPETAKQHTKQMPHEIPTILDFCYSHQRRRLKRQCCSDDSEVPTCKIDFVFDSTSEDTSFSDCSLIRNRHVDTMHEGCLEGRE